MKRAIFVLFTLVLVMVVPLALPVANGQELETWPTSTPEEQGMDSEELAAYFTTWSQDHFNLDSMVVVRNGHIIAEAYGPLTEPDSLRQTMSASKSITGALIGVLLQEGLLEGLDTPVVALFSALAIENIDGQKEALTIRDLLTMGSGIECTDISVGPQEMGTTDIMETTDDWLQFALNQPMGAEPGSEWYYCSANTHILSGIITELTGMSAVDYAAEKLFAPLGIIDYAWLNSPTGVTLGYNELQLTPRDMAKIGYLYLNDGQWGDQQIIPADYAQASLGKQIETPWDDTVYGYQWWRVDSINISFALGFGGQYIMVLPDKDMVVAVTSSMNETVRPGLQAYPMFFTIVGLATSDEPLPDNPEGVEALSAVLDGIHNPVAQPVPPLPELAGGISGQVFGMSLPDLFMSSKPFKRYATLYGLTESLGVNWFSLTFDDSAEAVLALGFIDEEMLSLPVGLDGLYRISEGRLGTVGVKGVWLGDSTFRVYLLHEGESFLHRFDINFMPGGIDVISYEYMSGDAIALHGFGM